MTKHTKAAPGHSESSSASSAVRPSKKRVKRREQSDGVLCRPGGGAGANGLSSSADAEPMDGTQEVDKLSREMSSKLRVSGGTHAQRRRGGRGDRRGNRFAAEKREGSEVVEDVKHQRGGKPPAKSKPVSEKSSTAIRESNPNRSVHEKPELLLSALRIDSDGWMTTAPGENTQVGTKRESARDAGPELLPSTVTLLKLICPSFNASTVVIGGENALQYSTKELKNLRHVKDLFNCCVKAINDIDKMRSQPEKDETSEKGDEATEETPRQRESNDSGETDGKDEKGGDKKETSGQQEPTDPKEKAKLKQERAKKRSLERRQMRIKRLEVLQKARIERRRGQARGGGGEDSPPASESPASRVCAAGNSLRALLRVLVPALHHPYRLDSELKMSDGTTLRGSGGGKRRKSRRCFLFFPEVFGTTTTNGLNALEGQLSRAAAALEAGLFSQMDAAQGRSGVRTEHECHEEGQAEDPLNGTLRRAMHRGTWAADQVASASLRPFLWGGSNERSKKDAMESIRLAARVDTVLIKKIFQHHPRWVCEQHRLAVDRLVNDLRHSISTHPGVRIDVYGSCLSELALGQSSDVDVSLHLPWAARIQQKFESGEMNAQQYDRKITSSVFDVSNALRSARLRGGPIFTDIIPVAHARVPVVKGTYLDAANPFSEDGSLSFDICFLNDIAVANSQLLAEYSRLDYRVRLLMLSVKSWAKVNGVGSAADGTLSSYAWMNLCIFYLQCIGFVPNLQCPHFMRDHGFQPKEWANAIDGLNTGFVDSDAVAKANAWRLPQDLKSLSTASLLSGFFFFYLEIFPQFAAVVSIRLGRCALLKTAFESARVWRLCIEDPFETHDSHRPHDLGLHLEEKGHTKVMNCLKKGLDVTTSAFSSHGHAHVGKAEEELGISAIRDMLLVGGAGTGPTDAKQFKKQYRKGKPESNGVSKESHAPKIVYYMHNEQRDARNRRDAQSSQTVKGARANFPDSRRFGQSDGGRGANIERGWQKGQTHRKRRGGDEQEARRAGHQI